LTDFAENAKHWARRAAVIPAYFVLTALAVAAFPPLLAIVVVLDVLRRNSYAYVRCLCFLTLYLVCESLGILVAFLAWLFSGVWFGAGRERFETWNYGLQRGWAAALFYGALRIFDVTLEVAGGEPRDRAPFILFGRHASLPDVILPAALFVVPYGLRIRHVMKRELLWDPCLDIVGRRLPNCFVRRGAENNETEIAGLRELMQGLGARDGVMIYPEGTRFTRKKQEAILARLAGRIEPALWRQARELRHLLPPRLTGALALLEENRRADAIFCAHVGFEKTTRLVDFLNGSLIGRTIRVRLWRIPFVEIPAGRDERVQWLYDNWRRIDEWIGENGAEVRSQKSEVRS